MREICPKEEMLQLSDAVREFSIKLLTQNEITKADDLTKIIVLGRGSNRLYALSELQKICMPPPKRPLWYLCADIRRLPSRTRSIVFHASALIELLCKAMLYDKIENKMPVKASLGPVINRLFKKKIITQDLFDLLCIYNNEFFSPAKHNWNVKNRRHLFTSKEAIYCIFISFSIAKILRSQNEYVDLVAQGKVDFDFIY